MSPLRNVPIRQKLIFITMTTVATSLLLAGVLFLVWDDRAFRMYASEDIGTTATLMADNLKAAVAFGDPGAASETLGSLRAKRYVASACVYTSAHAVMAAYARSGASPTCPAAERPDGNYFEGRHLLVFRPIVIEGKRVGTVFLQRTFEDVERQLRLQIGVLVLLFAGALLVGLLLSDRLQRLVSAPIAGLARTARAVTRGRDYSLRAERPGGDELGTLVDSFNEMLAEIQQRTADLQDTKAELERTVQSLQEASRVKDEFLATVSHELRTPLNAMMGWARMLRMDAVDDAGRRRAVESIERNAVAQARIVDDLLDISRIVTGKLRLDLKPLGLKTVIAAALDVVRPSAEARHIRLLTDLSGAAQDTVLGDADRLQQMIWNLLSNAVKFTPKGGEVRVSLAQSDGLELRISDTGRGIDPHFLPHAFDLFRQADSSSTREHGGLGLGLALARRIVELHGGSIRIDSDGHDCGTTVTVNLPGKTRGSHGGSHGGSHEGSPGGSDGGSHGGWSTGVRVQ
jgi:signal transduction histidine kinase